MLSQPPTIDVQLIAGGRPGDDYSIAELHLAAGATLPPHVCSKEDGKLIVLTGELEVELADSVHVMRSGDVLSIPRAKPRRLRVLSDVRLLCVSMPAGLERLADLFGAGPIDPDDRAALLAAAGVSLLPMGWGARRG